MVVKLVVRHHSEADLIEQAVQYTNAVQDQELNLQGEYQGASM